MNTTAMERSDTEILSSVNFKLEPITQSNEILKKKEFPVTVPPEEKLSVGRGHSNITFAHTETSGSEPAYVYIPQNNISRPRNKFIIARTILSKVVKSHYSGLTFDVSRITSKIWTSGQGSFQSYFNYLAFLESEWHECYYPLYQFNPKSRSTGPKAMTGMAYTKNLFQKNVSVVLLKDPDDTPKDNSRSSTPATRIASDINDMTNYVKLCTSSFEDGHIKSSPGPEPVVHDSSAYKDHTLNFPIKERAKVEKKPSAKILKPKGKKTLKRQIDLVFTKFNSPLYGEVEDVCINQG